jgi:Tfp pilus assembly protein PilW
MTPPRSKMSGLSTVELLVSLTVAGLVMAGVLSFLIAYRRVTIQEELSAALEANLNVGLRRLSESLRNAGFGVPTTNLSTWVPWVSGFTTNPTIINGGTAPDTLLLASCTTQPVATLTANAASGATVLTVNSTSGFNTTNRRLITIGVSEYAQVTNIGSGTITIDTDPTTSGNQGLSQAYYIGTPICRVDVVTYSVDTNNYRLLLDRNDGAGPQILLDGINNLKVTSITAKQYQITLTARSEQPDPETQAFLTRRMQLAVTLRSP